MAVAEAYLEESNALASEADRSRRNLLDRLLGGNRPGVEEERRAERLGLSPAGEHAVVTAVAAAGEDEEATRLIAHSIAREEPGPRFVVARHAEVVAILPVYVRRGPRELRLVLERIAERLERSYGVRLRAGISSVCLGLAELARGYGEAHSALRQAGTDGGVIALEEISLTEYLADGADETARRLIPQGTRALLTEDRR